MAHLGGNSKNINFNYLFFKVFCVYVFHITESSFWNNQKEKELVDKYLKLDGFSNY